jgi:Na+/melibiose symporter-like transporter
MADSAADAGPPARAASGVSITGISALFGALYLVQSVGDPTSGLIAQPVRSLLRADGERPAAIAGIMALLALPWALKPLFALLSDFVPLLGSRRRSYLIASTAVAALGLGAAYLAPLGADDRWLLVLLLLLPTLGIAFSDVVADALMIEIGKPRGLTGRLQSVQWSAAWLALLLSGVVGGWLTSTGRHGVSFVLCALLWTASLVLTLLFVREPPRAAGVAEPRSAAAALRAAVSVPGLLTICVVSFVWDCNLLSGSVNYLHVTGTLGLSEQVSGSAFSCFSAGALAAAAGYALYCRRIGAAALLHCAIATGVLGNVLYWWVTDAASLYVVSALAGLAYMTGSLILLDLAARLVPIPVAATVFAVIMSLASLGSSVGEAVGGVLFERASDGFGPDAAYRVVLFAGAIVIASCWLWVPRLRRELARQTQT